MSTTIKDFNRLSIETLHNLLQAVITAEKELQGDETFEQAVGHSGLFCDLVPIQLMAFENMKKRRSMKYCKMQMHDLLRELYQRMQMFHHYSECKGRELPGISHRMEDNGVFTIILNECALNLEHSFKDHHAEYYDKTRDGKLFCIGLNLPLLEKEDPESKDSHLYGEYDEFLNFCCLFDDDNEYRDIYPGEDDHATAIRDILAGLDAIAEMKIAEMNNK